MRAFALNCTLKPSPSESSTDVLLDRLAVEFATLEIDLARERVVDHHVRPGVTSDEGEGDQWPALLEGILDAEIFVLATPIWLGHPASTAQRVLERLDGLLSDVDDREQMRPVDKVAIVAVVGNEDGAHHVGAELFQGLNDVGFTIPANGMTYWVGEAMQGVDLKNKEPFPDKTAQTTRTAAVNAAHLAARLAADRYPSLSEGAGADGEP
ncbi:MAG: NAD(P)H-dependent oxidoreductase [Acidimicrobiales bacterium]|jgi:multimeric flavodoxin WrbA|nr:NAD(P)H-dependent oxidoreductase [Acidimicrobiales bacterium]